MLPADLPMQYFQYNVATGWKPVENRVIVETAVSLTVNGEAWLSFTCTPQDLDVLAIGFLYNEGIIEAKAEIAAIDICNQGTNVDVWLYHQAERPKIWQRTSGCTGGVTAVPDVNPPQYTIRNGHITPQMLLTCMDQLLQSQELYREAGGVHGSALSDGVQIRARAEDIGRHNTLDKLAGRILLSGIEVQPAILLTTGRVSSEMLQKSARIGASAVVSRTSPTSQSVMLADQLGITLVGYARRNGFLVYTHPERLSQDNG